MAGPFHEAATRIQPSPPIPLARECVGREREIARLGAFARRVIAQQRVEAAMIHGAPGIGKRRICREVIARLQHQGIEVRALECSPPPDPGRALGYLESLLRARFGPELRASDPARALVQTLRGLVPTQEVVELSFTVATLLGVELPGGIASLEALQGLLRDPSARGPFLVDTLRRLIQWDAQGQPLVILLQRSDLADAESAALLQQIFGELGAVPVALILLQPDASGLSVEALTPSGGWDQSRRQTWERLQALQISTVEGDSTLILGRESPLDPTLPERSPPQPRERCWGLSCESLALGPLDELGMEALIRKTLAPVQGLPDALVSMLLVGLGGLPAKLEPALAALVSHRVLEQSAPGRWRAHLERLSGEDLPAELEALSLARLRSLPPKHRALLELASVVGAQFRVSQALALCRLQPEEGAEPFAEGRSEARLQRVLLEAQGWDLLEYRPDLGRRGDEVFAFRFAQEREILYRSLEPERRARCHRVLAQLLELQQAEPARQAEHWACGGDVRRAALAHLRAGIEASARAEATEAVRALRHALERLDLDEGEPFLQGLAALAESLQLLGEPADAACEELAAAAYVLALPYYGAKSWLLRAGEARRRGDLAQATERLQRALGLLEGEETAQGRALRAEALDELSMCRWQHGAHHSEALELARRARALRQELGDAWRGAQTLLNMVQLHFASGDLEEAWRCAREAEALARAEGRRQLVGRALNAMGVLAMTGGDLAQAEEHWQGALELSRDLGDRSLRAAALSNLGELALRRDQGELARDLLERAVHLSRSIGQLSASAESLRHLSQIAFAQGDVAQAIALGRETLTESRRAGAKLKEALALRNLGELWGASGDPREAERCLRASIELLEAMGDQMDLRQSLESYGAFLRAQGRRQEEAQVLRRLR
jgi:tetratricopeptide (TPR) repeat protein